ncbi:MAG: AAA family ATPase [Thiotrichaceae bacterium]
MSNTEYQPPEDLYEAMALLEFDEALESDDPRYVDTLHARGDDFKMNQLYRLLRVNDNDPEHFTLSKQMPPRNYILFSGHVGCGKSTELRRVIKKLNHKDLFFVVFLDVLKELDINNISYADVLFALVKQLFETLKEKSIAIDQLLLQNLQDWFDQSFAGNDHTRDMAKKISESAKDFVAGIEGAAQIPFLGFIFNRLTTYLQSNTTYKPEIRNVLTNTFSEFAKSFNQVIVAAENAIQRAGHGQRILFVIDGTDRLKSDDGKRFFLENVHQLTQINSYFIYCSPIYLLYQENQIHRSFRTFTLPMIKLHDRDGQPLPQNHTAMQQMVFQRFPIRFFTDPNALVSQLIQYSGGCPRELLRLLDYAFLEVNGDQFDAQAVKRAILRLSVDYKRILDSEDYEILAKLDCSEKKDLSSDRMKFFLYNMIVLEYNNFWRESHPAIKELPAYQQACEHVNRST